MNQSIFESNPELKKDHKEFKEIRDKHIAHPASPMEKVRLFVAAKGPGSSVKGIGSYSFSLAGLNKKDLKRFLRLLVYVEKQARLEETRLGDEMAREYIGPKSSWAKAQRAFEKVAPHRERLFPPKPRVWLKTED